MKGKLVNILLLLIFLAGLSLLLYPTVSNYYNSYLQSKIILQYSNQVNEMEDEAYEEELAAAREYNARLLERPSDFALPEELEEQYWSLLDATGSGIMGYVEIPSISVTLPIAHGTEEDTLEDYVGHIKWSSLPIGGESTHSVISGHRGLPSSELFTNIDHLEIGDTFYVHVLGQTLEYWVDNIAVVLPTEYDLLGIEEGKDYVTLLTCTPYGINSHRLLVRGIRVNDQVGGGSSGALVLKNEVSNIDIMVIVPVGLVILSVIVFLGMVLDSGKKKKNKRKESGEKHDET